MKIFRNVYFIISFLLLIFLGNNYYKYQFDKKIVFVDKSKEELILYFNDICLGAEYGNSKKITRKWKTPLNLYIVKDKNYKEQINFIRESVEKINELVSDNFKISISNDSINANGHLFLCSDEKLKTYPEPFKKIFNNVDINNFGFFNYNFRNNIIYNTSIFINTSKPIEFQKTAIIEEITQSLGFGNDSGLYSNSVFYQAKYDTKKTVLDFSEFDKELIKLLYNKKMKSGLNRLETEQVLREIIE
ncbi:DUF2927 domain-containing protein [Tamlana crocina]|uniref:DUF2927 domain-containing protein n=1 Tax=Tamlana crocina TaxID=393006 RepID=A0ABX1DHE6_9FLAO|nr:DUF2927 domain-containing protein [Tamlana crocina]NJX16443.1 DUF2927 domain-containing protein [Tamlana crocina]